MDFIYKKLVGDKGYISKHLFQRLFVDGIQLATKFRSNMKGAIMKVADRILLRKRAVIKTINDELKILHKWNTSKTQVFRQFHRKHAWGIGCILLLP